MSYADRAALAAHPGFRDRVRVAAVVTAVNVAAETPNADQRVASLRKTLATNTLGDPIGATDKFTWAVLTNATVGANGLAATDGDLEFTVSSIWNALAGV